MSNSQNIEINAASLTRFLNYFVPKYLEKWNMAGMTISVVQNDVISFIKGYGYADLENQIPVNAKETMFRIASVSKIFTMIAVMQLVEKGILDLDVDVNEYLTKFKIPDTYPNHPITLYHLLIQRAGFEDTYFLGAKDSERNLLSLGEIAKNCLPKRIWAPGTIMTYSNYGFVLSGYIVEIMSNQSFYDYVEDNIFKPLNMQSTTSRQPLPSFLQEKLSKGYVFDEGVFTPYINPLSPSPPAGSVSTTALDMAKFMIAFLNDGIYNGSRILKSKTIQEIQTRQFSYHSELPGICYAFWESFSNDQRSLIHTGDIYTFHSKLQFIPKLHLGIFFSFNTYNPQKMGNVQESYKLQWDFTREFMNYFFPTQVNNTPYEPLNSNPLHFNKFVGKYRVTVIPYKSVSKSVLLLGYSVSTNEITANSDGTLNWEGKTLIETSPNFFQTIDGEYQIYFIEDDNGRVIYAGINIHPTYTFEKIYWYDYPEFHYFLLIFSLVIFCFTALMWSINSIKHRIQKQKVDLGSLRIARIVVGLGCLIHIVLVIAYLLWMLFCTLSISDYITTQILSFLPIISIKFASLALIYPIFAWKDKSISNNRPHWNKFNKIHSILILIANFMFIYLLNYWYLFGFSFIP